MNTNKVNNKMNFSHIFDMVNQRQHILQELRQVQQQEQILQNQLKDLDKPFKENTIDINFYKEFFKYYYVENNNTGAKYIVTDFIKEHDNVDNVPFWSVKFIYESNNKKHEAGPLSLRRFLHMLDNGFVFKEKTT